MQTWVPRGISRHASLFKAQEEEDGKMVDILDIVIDTDTNILKHQ